MALTSAIKMTITSATVTLAVTSAKAISIFEQKLAEHLS